MMNHGYTHQVIAHIVEYQVVARLLAFPTHRGKKILAGNILSQQAVHFTVRVGVEHHLLWFSTVKSIINGVRGLMTKQFKSSGDSDVIVCGGEVQQMGGEVGRDAI